MGLDRSAEYILTGVKEAFLPAVHDLGDAFCHNTEWHLYTPFCSWIEWLGGGKIAAQPCFYHLLPLPSIIENLVYLCVSFRTSILSPPGLQASQSEHVYFYFNCLVPH